MEIDGIKDEIKNIIETIQNELKTIDKEFKKYKSITKKNDELFSVFEIKKINDYSKYLDKLKEINYKKVSDKIEAIDSDLVYANIIINKEWKKYNNSYKLFLNNKIDSLEKTLKNLLINYKLEEDKPGDLIYNLKIIQNVIIDFDPNIRIFSYFSKKDKNFVVFGRNGSGKTRLLNYVREKYYNNNSFVISANRKNEFVLSDDIFIKNNNGFNFEKNFNNIQNISNSILFACFKNLMQNDYKIGNTIIEKNYNYSKNYLKLLNIFNKLGIDRKIMINEDGILELYNDEIMPYYIDNASDGEKNIIQFILYILQCPKNCFLFIDEPELHLNSSLVSELFNMLESERKDIVFIYFTHNVDFIESRENSELIFLNEFNGQDWNVELYKDFNKIPIDSIIKIIGTKKDILFVEGNYNSYDYKLYSKVFDNCKVIPFNSCEQIINACKLLNNNNYNFIRQKCFGIIDNDFRTKEEIQKYKRYNIYTLPYMEIENLLISTYVLDLLYSKEDINKYKQKVFEKALELKKDIISDYINKSYYKHVVKTKYSYNDDLKDLINDICDSNNKNIISFKEDLEKYINNLDNILKNNNYEELLKTSGNKSMLNCIFYSSEKKDNHLKKLIDTIDESKNVRIELQKIIMSEELYMNN